MQALGTGQGSVSALAGTAPARPLSPAASTFSKILSSAGRMRRNSIRWVADSRASRRSAAPVVRIGRAHRKTGVGQTIYQLDGAMVLDAQPVGQISDARLGAFCRPLDRQQGLVLARRQSCLCGRLFAEREKTPWTRSCPTGRLMPLRHRSLPVTLVARKQPKIR